MPITTDFRILGLLRDDNPSRYHPPHFLVAKLTIYKLRNWSLNDDDERTYDFVPGTPVTLRSIHWIGAVPNERVGEEVWEVELPGMPFQITLGHTFFTSAYLLLEELVRLVGSADGASMASAARAAFQAGESLDQLLGRMGQGEEGEDLKQALQAEAKGLSPPWAGSSRGL